MKRKRLAGLLALCLAAPLGVVLAEEDSAKAKELAQEFNVTQSQLMDVRTKQELNWDEIRTSLMLSQHSGASLDEVVRLKKSGMSFEDIAGRYNLKLEDIEKAHVEKGKKEGEFREAPAPRRVHRKASRLSEEYNVPAEEVMRLRDRGLSWKEVRHALFIAEQSGRPVNEIVSLSESGMDWDDIASRYNVNLKEEGKKVKEKATEREQMREAPREEKKEEPQKQQEMPQEEGQKPEQQQPY